MAYEAEDVAVFLGDLGGTVTDGQGAQTEGLLKESDVFKSNGQEEVKVGTARLIIATGSPLTLAKQSLYEYRETPTDPPRVFRLREPVRRGAFTHLIVVEETA